MPNHALGNTFPGGRSAVQEHPEAWRRYELPAPGRLTVYHALLPELSMTPYRPAPIDTSAVTLSKALTDLLEVLAENTHNVWAARRLAQGWTYGPCRDDAAKKHPSLVPYRELRESEKEYDRRT